MMTALTAALGLIPLAMAAGEPGSELLAPLAIAAGYLGLLSPLLIFAPFALLCGVLAIADIRRDPRKHGMGRAVFGLVMGVVFSLLFLIMILAVAMDSR